MTNTVTQLPVDTRFLEISIRTLHLVAAMKSLKHRAGWIETRRTLLELLPATNSITVLPSITPITILSRFKRAS